jgi:hypothetical protein
VTFSAPKNIPAAHAKGTPVSESLRPPTAPGLQTSGTPVGEFRMMVDPVFLGGGKRIFRDDGVLRALRLVESQVTTTGAIIATYAPAEQA